MEGAVCLIPKWIYQVVFKVKLRTEQFIRALVSCVSIYSFLQNLLFVQEMETRLYNVYINQWHIKRFVSTTIILQPKKFALQQLADWSDCTSSGSCSILKINLCMSDCSRFSKSQLSQYMVWNITKLNFVCSVYAGNFMCKNMMPQFNADCKQTPAGH